MGSHHNSWLVPAFSASNIELLLLHLGSWGEDTGRPKEEVIDGLLVRDISYYDRGSFDQMLEAEQPDLVLFLSTEIFLHQAFKDIVFQRCPHTAPLSWFDGCCAA